MMHYGPLPSSFGLAALMPLVLMGVLVVVPFWRLLPRFGMPSWVAILAIFPLIALILLWVMAFRDGTTREAN